jgi:tRNA A37 threonylcarbamoyladenosine biosynthesis protein TsaE
MVHAGAVAHNERCVLLVGDAGAGKSTTTMACFGQGLEVLGDDFCFVESPTDRRAPVAHTMYRLAKLDDRSMSFYPWLRERIVGTGWRGKKLIDLGEQPRSHREIAAVCRVVQDPSRATYVEPESRARTLRAVAPSTLFQQRLWEREMWAVLTSVVRAVPCYRLSVSSVDAVPGVMRSLLEADL